MRYSPCNEKQLKELLEKIATITESTKKKSAGGQASAPQDALSAEETVTDRPTVFPQAALSSQAGASANASSGLGSRVKSNYNEALYDLKYYKIFQKTAKFCSMKWLTFGTNLGFQPAEVHNFVSVEGIFDDSDKFLAVAAGWLSKVGREGTLGTFLKAIDDIGHLGDVENAIQELLPD
eukprot:m.126696 g.126696  ORF g.126696 m.126696 type:complete len:179 (+) comp37915_c0_seq14:1154-1690(+)